jgi:hypothetical protein
LEHTSSLRITDIEVYKGQPRVTRIAPWKHDTVRRIRNLWPPLVREEIRDIPRVCNVRKGTS